MGAADLADLRPVHASTATSLGLKFRPYDHSPPPKNHSPTDLRQPSVLMIMKSFNLLMSRRSLQTWVKGANGARGAMLASVWGPIGTQSVYVIRFGRVA